MSDLRVLTYNVHGQRDDRVALRAVVRRLEPDVVLVQEGPVWCRWRHRSAALADSFGLVFGAGGLSAVGNLVLTNLRVRVHRAWTMHYPLVLGRHVRGVALASCSVGGSRFVVSGSHLSTNVETRQRQAARWRTALSAVDVPLVIGGDLNEGPGGPAWRVVSDGLVDTGVAGGGDGFTFPSRAPGFRLDALFVSPTIQVRRCTVIDSDEARRASDHLPVLAELSLPPD